MYGWGSWTTKKAECWRIDAFEPWHWRRLMRVPWTARRSNQSVSPKGNHSWIFIGSIDAPILWLPDAKNWLIGKEPDAGKGWRQEEKGRTEDEMAGWPHWPNGHESSSGSWWWTGKPGVLQSLRWQRVTHDWLTEVNWDPLSKGLLYLSSLNHAMQNV